jgi:hypothetical protein
MILPEANGYCHKGDRRHGDRKKAGEMRIRLPISVTDCRQITNLPADTQILKGRTTWRDLPSIFLILRYFDYLPRFFSVSIFSPPTIDQSSSLSTPARKLRLNFTKVDEKKI